MNDPKTFASLSPTLLARKGAAKPAMRPQLQPLQQFHEATARQLEDDLGWNDMGHEHDDLIVSKDNEPAPSGEVVAFNSHASTIATDVPEIVRQQNDIAERVASDAGRVAADAAPRRSALARGRRAAFTLRLDAERHLKLRLACTINNRSAQQIVIEALDRLIEDLPDVASLAAQVGNSR